MVSRYSPIPLIDAAESGHDPEHLTEMGGDLRIWHQLHGVAQVFQRGLMIPTKIFNPAQTVDDCRIIRRQPVGLANVLIGFFKAVGAIGEGITPGIECRGIVRFGLQ